MDKGLRIENVTVKFRGLTAVANVSMLIDSGEIHGLIGPNGAGKTSLINAISGLIPLAEGRVLLDGQELQNVSASRIAEAGVGLWAEPAPIRGGRYFARGDAGQPVEALQAMFAMLGYGVTVDGIFDDKLEAVVAAFQRHWRPEKVDGVADSSTITTLRDLLAASRGSRSA